jgi:hypothetical protein
MSVASRAGSVRRAGAALLAVLAVLATLVLAGARPAAAGPGSGDPDVWSASGPGTVTLIGDGSTSDPSFSYEYCTQPGCSDTGGGGVPTQTWTFEATAATAETVTLPYTYTGNHRYAGVTVFLNSFVTPAEESTTTTPLVSAGPASCVDPGCAGDTPSGGFTYTGTQTFTLSAGETYGFTLGGGNGDSDSILQGTFTLDTASYTVAAPPANTAWTTATPLVSNQPVTDAITQAGEDLWYKFPVTPDSQVQVSLTNVPADDDIALFSDIGQAFDTQLTSTSQLTELSAESPGSASSPSAFSPSAFSPSAFSPSAFSPSAFSPSAFSPSAFSPSVFSPSAFSPSAFSPSAFSPSAFSGAYADAQTDSLLAVSTVPGAVAKSVSADTWNNTGYFYVRISGNNGASSPNPYTLTEDTTGGPCQVPLNSYAGDSTITGVPGSARTLILTDSTRLPMATLTGPLATLASMTGGVVVDVSKSQQVDDLNAQADANPSCPYAKNLVAQAIRNIVNSYRDGQGTLKYVVIVGDDDVIPFFRYADNAGLAPESDYSPPLSSTTAADATLASDDYLSDDAYGAASDLSVKGTTFPVADVAVGRLVESPSDILAQVEEFITDNGQLPTPTSSLVTGYDFMQPAADAVEAQFSAGLGAGATNAQLITNQGVSPSSTTPAGSQPSRTYSWTATDLKNALFGSHHDLVFLGAHFSANNALAADYSSTITTTDLTNAVKSDPTLFDNTLILGAGCHAGYNIEDADGVTGVTDPLDWPQAFTQAGATLIAGSGYQYGDTDFVAYSDALYVDIARELRTGTGSVAIGTALLNAKQDYLDGVSQLAGIDEKSLLETTLYGLPMLGIDEPGARITPAAPTSTVTATGVGSGPGSVLGLQEATLSVSPTLTPQSQPISGGGTTTWDSGPQGVVAEPDQPTLPLQVDDVTVPGEVLRGVGFRSGTYADTTGTTPLTGTPATELGSTPTTFSSAAFFPQTLWNPNYFGSLANPASGETSLALTPVQYRSDAGGASTDTQRTYSNLGLSLYYSNNIATYGSNTPALAAPPTISQVTSTVNADGSITFSARVTGDPSAGIQDAWVTYTGDTSGDALYGSWQSLDLIQSTTDSTLWQATLPAGTEPNPGDLSFIVQAVDGVGQVSLDDNDGTYFSPGITAGQPAAGAAASTLTLSSTNPSSAGYGSSVTVSATLSGPGAGGQPVTFGVGSASVAAVTNGSGVATATIPLADPPGGDTLSASYAGSAGLQPATASAPFTIAPAATTLSISTTTSAVPAGANSGVSATLTSGGAPLTSTPVYFDLSAGGAIVDTVVATTNEFGVAPLGALSLPAGTYTVSASFGSPAVALVGGGSADAAEPDYQASSASTTLQVIGAPTITSTVADAATNASWAGTEVTGASAYDTVGLAGVGGYTPTGTVTYSLFSGSTCAGSPTASSTVTLSGGSVPNSPASGPLGPGSYSYQAVYSGDGTYPSGTGPCEPFGVAKTAPALASVVDDAATNAGWAGTEVTGAAAYDTATVSGVAGFTPTGTVTYALFAGATCASSPVSSATVTLSGGVVPASPSSGPLGAGSYSYQASYSGDGTYPPATGSCEPFALGKAPLTVTASTASMTYGGTAPTVTPSYGGFVPGFGSSTLTSPAVCGSTGTSATPAGTYPAATSCSGAADPDYTISYVTGTLTVNPAPLVVTGPSPSAPYGAAIPALTAGYSGFVNHDTTANLTHPATCTTIAVAGSPAGPYPVTCSGAADPNYTISYVAGSLSVVPVALTITASSAAVVYGSVPPAITASYAGFVHGDTAASLTRKPTCSTTATAASPAALYPSTCTGATDPNYTISYLPGIVTVTPAATTVSYTGLTQVGVSSSLTPTASVSSPATGCVGGQQVGFALATNPTTGAAGTFSLGSATSTSSGTATAAAVSTKNWLNGVYTLTVTVTGTSNCTGTSQTLTLAVTVPGQAAAGAGVFPGTGSGPTSFGFVVALVPHSTSTYVGAMSVLIPGKWLFTGSITGYGKTSSTQGLLSGTGTVSWWNATLNRGCGGWVVAKTGVSFTATANATTKSGLGSFGIALGFTPVAGEPTTSPSFAPQNLTLGAIGIS